MKWELDSPWGLRTQTNPQDVPARALQLRLKGYFSSQQPCPYWLARPMRARLTFMEAAKITLREESPVKDSSNNRGAFSLPRLHEDVEKLLVTRAVPKWESKQLTCQGSEPDWGQRAPYILVPKCSAFLWFLGKIALIYEVL